MFKLLFKLIIRVLKFGLHKLLSDFSVVNGLQLVSWLLNHSELLIKEKCQIAQHPLCTS